MGDVSERVDDLSDCPELAALEEVPLSREVSVHVRACTACRLVVDVFDDVQRDQCVRFDALLAARADGTLNRAGGNLLERHLASCEPCRVVADTLSPSQDAHGDLATLPKVDPAHYALGLEVARGGMGRIMAARDLRVGRPVAVKELLGRSPQLAARFEREARVTARLQHPGIVPIYEIGRWPDGTPFYSMRMVDGDTLRGAIERAATLPQRLALLPALIAACEAVAFAHGQRVIHRDLTPSNILVGAYGETVVIDWGLAKDLSIRVDEDAPDPYRSEPSDSSGHLTAAGSVVGTASYMPPEQAAAEPVDERADVYALGAILYHLLAGRPPYRPHPSALLEVKAGPPRPVAEVAAGAPRELTSIVDKAMAREPDARYPSARELAEELNRFRAGRMVEAHAYSRGELVRRFVRRNRAAVAITAAAAVSLATVGGVAISRILASRASARATARALLLENGRNELLAGNAARALAYLHRAQLEGERSPEIDYMLASALVDVESSEQVLDCGPDPRHITLAPDGESFVASCHDVARVYRFDGKELARLTSRPGAFDNAFYSRDGARIVTFGDDQAADVWDARSGAHLATLQHGQQKIAAKEKLDGITFATFSPDDDRIATTGMDGKALVWTPSATGYTPGPPIPVTNTPLSYAYGVFGANNTVVAVTMEGIAHGFDASTGRDLGGFEHGGKIYGGELSPDRSLATTCGHDGRTKVWDARTGRSVHTLAGHDDVVWKCVFSADSRYVLSTSHDGTAKVWSVETGTTVTTVAHGDIVWTGHFSADRRRFLTVGVDNGVKVWDTQSGALLAAHANKGGKDAMFAPDGRIVALRGDGSIEMWRAPATRRIAFGADDGAKIAGVTADGTYAIVEEHDQSLSVVSTLEPTRLAHELLFGPVAVARKASRFAARDLASNLVILDIGERVTVVRRLGAGTVTMVELSADGSHVVTLATGRRPTVWDVATGNSIQLDIAGNVLGARLSDDGARAIVWSDVQPPTVWDLARRVPIAILAPTEPYRVVGFDATGHRVLLSQPQRHATTLWDADSGRLLLDEPDIDESRRFDTTGRWLTTISPNQTVTVWDAATALRHTEFVADRPLQQAQSNPDGTLVSAIGEYGKAVFVVGATGRVLAQHAIERDRPSVGQEGFKAPDGESWWSPDGRWVVSKSRAIAVWQGVEPLAPERVALAAEALPWRVVDGHLAGVHGRLAGRVRRGSTNVHGARVSIAIRRPPEATTDVAWGSRESRLTELSEITDEGGDFVFDDLVPGNYAISVDGVEWRQVRVTVETEPLDVALP